MAKRFTSLSELASLPVVWVREEFLSDGYQDTRWRQGPLTFVLWTSELHMEGCELCLLYTSDAADE